LSRREQIKGYIAPIYAVDLTTGGILDTGADELEGFENGISDVLNQFFVDTATWALVDWENTLAIPPDESKPLNERRSVIKSKLRGSGTITVSLIESVAEAYENGDVQVTEHPGEYRLTIKFIDTRGVPPNVQDLMGAIEQIKPAHLSVIYEYTYLYWDELDAGNVPWNQLDTMTWDTLETTFFN
jgi:hypothetical protein